MSNTRLFPRTNGTNLMGLLAALSLFVGCAGGDGITDSDDPPANPVATTVTVSPEAPTLEAGGATVRLTATVRDQSGDPMPQAPVTWTSSTDGVATVDSDGLVTSGIVGDATVTATSGGASGTAEVSVIPRPVATVEVAPSTVSLEPGATVQLSVVLRDDTGETLDGRNVDWVSSAPTVAEVDDSGRVTAVSEGGPVTVTASSEGVDGSAQVTVVAPVESVTVTGHARVKVGDTYTYTAEARLGDGTPVERPMTWSVAEASRGDMTANGTLTVLTTGTITLQVTIDGEVWQATVEAYDWISASGGGSLFLALEADIKITNQFGTSELPEMVFACSDTGSFLMWVDTDHFVTANGTVAYSFDTGTIVAESWIEFDSFSALAHPGPTNLATKGFALEMAAARTFEFGFSEFQSEPRVTVFRVTGMTPLLEPLLDACPSNGLRGDTTGAPIAPRNEATSSPAVTGASIQEAVGAARLDTTYPSELAELKTEYRAARGRMDEGPAKVGTVEDDRVRLRHETGPATRAPIAFESGPASGREALPASRKR